MSNRDSIGIGLMGLGVVGSGVANALSEKAEHIASQVGCPVRIRRALVRDLRKKRLVDLSPECITTDPSQLLNDPDIDIVVEVVGGEASAVAYIREAIEKGKHVVTANKEVMAKHGPELLALAADHNVSIYHEASVGGGIPIISPFREDLAANKITAIHAIINGTTNYILTRMAEEGLDFATALRRAQELGYAEPDPANDIEGIDAAYKLAILASIAFTTEVRPESVYREGVSRLASRDFRYASETGYAIKLLAIAKQEDDLVQARVHPVLIPDDQLLAKVDGVYNAIQVEGDLTGRVIFYGQGAGSLPTASAVIADVIRAAQIVNLGLRPKPYARLALSKKIVPMADITTRYYMRITIADRSGVLAQISRVLGDLDISIASVIQKETDYPTQTAEIMLMTHPAQESAVQQALKRTAALDVVKEIGNMIRIED